MTIGQKIRFYRDLRGYTQAELGSKVHLQADRIRQYGTNVRTPKMDKLKEIADALDVDVAALSDINIQSEEDIMHILFELEDNFSINIEKQEGKTVIVIDNEDNRNSALNTFLNYWHDKKQAFDPEGGNESRAKEYISWRGRFGSNERVFEESIIQRLEAAYKTEVEKLTKAKSEHCVTTSDLTRLLCRISPDVILGTTTKRVPYTKDISYGFVFDATKLLKPECYSKDFALFLYELGYFKKLGCNWYSAIEYTGSEIKIIYYIPINSFNVVTSMVDDWLNYAAKSDSYSVFAKEEFEQRFESDLQSYSNNIKEEIKFYGK